ncbi:hypothetical protein ACP70R_043314 [Stipagrostis hirtigluma subsp. patula]
MGDEKFSGFSCSLHPPHHGYNDEAPPTSWVLLDRHTYIADRENATSACGTMSNGKVIRVTLCTAPPPLVSYICVWCPDLPPTVFVGEPTVEADLVLFRLFRRGPRRHADYFVYKATGSKGPSLQLLQDPSPCLPVRNCFSLLPRVHVGGRGNDLSSLADGDDHYYIAVLSYRGNGPGELKLHVFDSMDKSWRTIIVDLEEDFYCHITSKVTALGEGGLLAFVDAWRGIVVCDVLGRRPPRYLPLPANLIVKDMIGGEPLLSRDIAFVDGRLVALGVWRILSDEGSIPGYSSWTASSWSRPVTDSWDEDWQEDYTIQSPDIAVHDAENTHLLPKLEDSEGTPQPTLRKLYMAHPTLSLIDKHIFYIMGKVNPKDEKALVLSIDMRSPKLQGVVVFDAERMLGPIFGYAYMQSWVSKYLSMAPGAPGIRRNPKRPESFHMLYPRKLKDRITVIPEKELQDTGTTKEAEDEDDVMVLG